jgi:hypothetical protein
MLTGFRKGQCPDFGSRTPLFWIANSVYSTEANSLLRWIKLTAPDQVKHVIEGNSTCAKSRF